MIEETSRSRCKTCKHYAPSGIEPRGLCLVPLPPRVVMTEDNSTHEDYVCGLYERGTMTFQEIYALISAERERCAQIAEKMGEATGDVLIARAIAAKIRVSSEADLITRLAVELRNWACAVRDSDGVAECNICYRYGTGDYHGPDCPLKGLPE